MHTMTRVNVRNSMGSPCCAVPTNRPPLLQRWVSYQIRLSTVHKSGPPMEAGVGTNECGLCLQPATAFHLDLLQLIECRKRPIRQRFVAQRPEPLTGLKFG